MAEPIDTPARASAPSAASTASGSSMDGAARRALPRWHSLGHSLGHYLAAAGLGALNTLSFAPTPHGGWLAIAIFAVFYFGLARTTGWKGALFTGWAFGFGNFVTGVWWLYVSMHVFGGMAAPLAGGALVLFSIYLGLYPGLAGAVWSVCAGHARKRAGSFSPGWYGAFAFASAWALGEWARGYVFTGFPWLASGYSQVDGPLAGFAPLVGVYGVGWVLALVAALIVQALVRAWDRRRAAAPNAAAGVAASSSSAASSQTAGARASSRPVTLPAAAALAMLVAGLLLPLVQWTHPANTPLDVRLLQGNVPQSMKFSESGTLAALAEFQKLITEKPADLVVTPETAVPVLLQEIPQPFGLAIRNFADATGTAILFGAVGATVTPDNRYTDFTNSLFGITPGQPGLYRYDKHHLVPFGEFIPLGFHWFMNLMHMPLGDFARGAPVQAPFVVHDQPVAVDVCYEDIFGEEIARTVRDSATPPGILINSTNLGWFGNTIALDQHLQMARMRTLETGRPMLRATNTGVTAAIDSHGRVIARLPVFTVGALDVRIEGTTGLTPYVRLGNTTVFVGSLLLLAFGIAGFTRRGKTGPGLKPPPIR